MTTPVLTQSQSQSGGVVNFAVGRVSADAGTAVAQTFTLGFIPRKVRWINLTDSIVDEWFEGMAADAATHVLANGTRSLVTSGGITVNTNAAGATNSGSFTVAAGLVVASKVFAWEAMG